MADEKKDIELEKDEETMELNPEDLEQVTGGSLKDVTKKETSDISENTAGSM